MRLIQPVMLTHLKHRRAVYLTVLLEEKANAFHIITEHAD